MTMLYYRALIYFSNHVMLNSIAHFAAGFGLALLLQHYIKKHAFLPPIIGWILVGLSAIIHAMAFLS
jgi:hypothetical protein